MNLLSSRLAPSIHEPPTRKNSITRPTTVATERPRRAPQPGRQTPPTPATTISAGRA